MTDRYILIVQRLAQSIVCVTLSKMCHAKLRLNLDINFGQYFLLVEDFLYSTVYLCFYSVAYLRFCSNLFWNEKT